MISNNYIEYDLRNAMFHEYWILYSMLFLMKATNLMIEQQIYSIWRINGKRLLKICFEAY